MKVLFVDSNIFLRFFTSDDKGQHEQATRLLRSAAGGEITLITGPPVLFEVSWTLRSAYKQPQDKVLEVLSRLVALPGLRMTDTDLVQEAIALARRSGQDFADAYIYALMQGCETNKIATFNRNHFERLGAVIHELD